MRTLAGAVRETLNMVKAKAKAIRRTPYTGRHKDGSLWAKGYMSADVMDGPWKWFRKDETLMRSGSFDRGRQCGEWVTYAQDGRIVKITRMKDHSRPGSVRAAAKKTATRSR